MIELTNIILRPLVTEKTMDATSSGKYAFEVCPDANKYQIKKAMKEVLNVDVLKVNIIRSAGKVRRFGKTTGRTKATKKAIVTIKPGQKIELFES
jgi:large subunit ribosomal protein L23